MEQVDWRIRLVRRIFPQVKIKISKDEIDDILHILLDNKTYGYVEDYFKGELKPVEISEKYNIDTRNLIAILRSTINNIKHNGYFISMLTMSLQELKDYISYNSTRYHISFLPLPIKLISILDRKYHYTMISDLMDLHYSDYIPYGYRTLVENVLIQFNLIDNLHTKYKDDEAYKEIINLDYGNGYDIIHIIDMIFSALGI